MAAAVRASSLELATSLDPRDYCYPSVSQLSAAQVEALAQQARLLKLPAGMKVAGAMDAPGSQPSDPAAQLLGVQGTAAPELPHLTLDLDEDCMHLLLAEEGDESKPASSSGASATTSTGGGGKEPTESAPRAPAPAPDEEDDLLLDAAPSLRQTEIEEHADVLLLRPMPPSCAPSTSAGDRSKCCSGSDGTTLGMPGEAGDQDGGSASPLKRVKSESLSAGLGGGPSAAVPAKPSPFSGLMLSMDYQSAVESINLQLTCGDCRLPEDELGESVLPISLSPVAGAKTPEGPDLLSPGCELLPSTASKWGLAVAEESGFSAGFSASASAKRKRR